MAKRNAIRQNVEKKVRQFSEKFKSVPAGPKPEPSEVDEAFEAITGHKRPTRENSEENALLPEENREKSGTVGNSVTGGKMAELTVTHKSTQKNGVHTYSADGYGWSVYFNKSAFDGAAPETITLGGAEFSKGSSRGGAKAATPERAAKEAEKLAKAEARIAKQNERLAKQREKVERLNKAAAQG